MYFPFSHLHTVRNDPGTLYGKPGLPTFTGPAEAMRQAENAKSRTCNLTRPTIPSAKAAGETAAASERPATRNEDDNVFIADILPCRRLHGQQTRLKRG